jgi:autotransporter translocation and assembly factor TamB
VLPLELLKDWLPAASRIDPRSTGQVSLKAKGTYAEPEIEATLEAKNLRSPEQPGLPPADLRIAISARDNLLTLEGNATAPDFPAAIINASMPFRPADWAENPGSVLEENVSARVDLPRLDLARYVSLVPAARRLAGVATGHIVVAGALGNPELSGSLQLSDGIVELKQEQIPTLSAIAATADLTPGRVVLRELRAEIAGGSLRGEGSLDLIDGKPGELDFRLTGRHVPLLRNDSMIVRAHADLRLAGAYETAALTGTVTLVDSLFFRDIEILPVGVPFTTPSAAALPRLDPPANPATRLPEPFGSWPLDLRLSTANPFLIRGNFASGMVTGDLRLRGTMGSPLPDGTVQISDLRAALPFSTLEVRRGTLRFTPETGFDPILEIRGTSNPRPYRVNGYVHGRASDPQLVLTSSPPLPPNEIMTLLATGTTTSGLENPQAAASRALQLFAEELRRGRFAVGRQLRPLLGLLDRVDFTLAESDPYSNDSYSTAMLSVTDRWYLSAGIGEEGDSRFLAIWRLTFH